MDLGAIKPMTSYMTTFDTYVVIAPSNVYLGDNNVVEAIEMGSIVVETFVRSKINRICIKDVFYVFKL